MAEFCVDCWNKIMDTNDPPKKFILAGELDICEECGQQKRCIIRVRRRYIVSEIFQGFIHRIRR